MQRETFFEDENLDRDQTTTGTNMEERVPRKLAYSERSKEIDQSRIKAWSQRCRFGTAGVESERILTFRSRDMTVHRPNRTARSCEVKAALDLLTCPAVKLADVFPKPVQSD